MKIAIGNDHASVDLKKHLVDYLTGKGYEVVNFGTDSNESTHYPIYAQKVADAVVSGQCDRGVLLCGTGIGISISANKIKGVRCALCSEPVSCQLSREHNNANIVAMGARIVGPVMAEAIVDTFLTTEFLGGRHAIRVNMIADLENGAKLS